MPVSAMLTGSGIRLGAQNMYWEESGASTGEVSPGMVAEFCQYVILGHSERRAYFGETDETVNRKVKAAFANHLTPIMCVGETLDENESGRTAAVIERQVREGLQGLETSLAENWSSRTNRFGRLEPGGQLQQRAPTRCWRISSAQPSRVCSETRLLRRYASNMVAR